MLSFNLVGWKTKDVYQNLNSTYLNTININQVINENLFKLPFTKLITYNLIMTNNLKDVTILIKNSKFTEALESLKELSEFEKKILSISF